ncbi:MAG: DUF2231 domain-containing protein [Myxococcota bacterium]
MRLLGHPLHALLVAFPIGLLALIPLWDGLAWLLAARELALVAYYSEVAGVVAAALAALVGFWDLLKLEADELRIGIRHALGVIAACSAFGGALALREPTELPSAIVCSLDGMGAVLLAVGGWFGAELVFGHGVGMRSRER